VINVGEREREKKKKVRSYGLKTCKTLFSNGPPGSSGECSGDNSGGAGEESGARLLVVGEAHTWEFVGSFSEGNHG